MITERNINTNFIGVLLLVATLVLFFFHTKPAQQDLAKLKAKVATLESELPEGDAAAAGDTTNGEASILAGSETALTEVEERELGQAIPKGLEQDRIITDLDAITKATDVNFGSLSFTLREYQGLPAVEVSGVFQGTSANIIRFLKIIEVNPRKFVIQDAGVARSDIVEGLDLVNLQLTLLSFYRET